MLAILGVIGAGPPTVLAILLLSVAGVVQWSREHPPQDRSRPDLPVRLVQWSGGLLPADRFDWGKAMLGELDEIESHARRWHFAVGCVAAVVQLPPRGSVGPLAALGSVALGSAVVFGIGFVHFGLATNPWNWVMLVILATLVIGSIVAVRVQLHRPGVARLGLMSGLLVAATWLAFSRFTFAGIISPIYSVGAWSGPAPYIAVPLAVGPIGAWRGGSASVGRRAARLAGVSAGLTLFFISTIAVVASDGGARDPGAGVAGGVSEAFSNVAMLFLISLPLAMTAFGWVAATATARIRHLGLVRPHHASTHPERVSGGATRSSPSHTNGRVVLSAAVTIAVVMAAVLLFLAR